MAAKRIGVLTSGGDCPGLNAVLRGIVQTAEPLGWEVIGFQDGFEGLLPPGDFITLDRDLTAGIMHLGGTILGTTNRGHFVARGRSGQRTAIAGGVIAKTRETFDRLALDGLVVIGGDGSLSIALQLLEAGFPVTGVPKTIDNDLEATAMTFGFDSALACVADALDRLHTTARSHKRVMVLEVMGRHTGWIALHGGLAGGADIILIPEIPFDLERVAAEVKRRDDAGSTSTMIVVAEGAAPRGGRQMHHATADGEYRLGGVGEMVAQKIGRLTGKETRTCVLGHLQRGGVPTAFDRILGTRFGVKAVELIADGNLGQMVNYQNDHVDSVPISHAVHRLRRVLPDSQMVRAARAVGITFGD